jgi:hypothetical protein
MRFGVYGVTIECGYEQTAAIEAKIMLDKMVANFKVGSILDKARFAITFGMLGQLTRNPLYKFLLWFAFGTHLRNSSAIQF